MILVLAFSCLFTAAACNQSGRDVRPRNPEEEIMPLPEPPLPRNQPHRAPHREHGNCVPI